MPFDLGDDAAGFCPASGLVGEVRVEAAHFVRRTPDRAREQVANPLLQDAVGGKPDRLFDALGLQVLIHIGIGEAGVGAEKFRALEDVSGEKGRYKPQIERHEDSYLAAEASLAWLRLWTFAFLILGGVFFVAGIYLGVETLVHGRPQP